MNGDKIFEGDTDVVYVTDLQGNVIFMRTFDLKKGGEPERQKAIATYTEVSEMFRNDNLYRCLTSVTRVKIQIYED